MRAVWIAALALAACSHGSGASEAPDAGSAIEDASDDAVDEANDAAASACDLPVLGDPTQPIQMTLTIRDVDGAQAPLADGDQVPLVTPPQGGKVLFVGVRATNLSPCGVVLSGALRDPSNGRVRLDGRTINLAPQDDGWGTSLAANIATFANVPVCPNQWASVDVYGNAFELEVDVTDASGRTATSTIHVTPTCAETDPTLHTQCTCTCKAGYTLGQTCN